MNKIHFHKIKHDMDGIFGSEITLERMRQLRYILAIGDEMIKIFKKL